MSQKSPLLRRLMIGFLGGLSWGSFSPVGAQTSPHLIPSAPLMMEEITNCVRQKLAPNFSQDSPPSSEDLQGIAMACVIRIIFLDEGGKIRADAHERMTVLMKNTGISVPQTTGSGQGSVRLQKRVDSDLFLVPVSVNGNRENFILDTGASNSIIESGLAQKLGLKGTKISSDILAYFVIGDRCDQISATLHSLPPFSVTNASVQGMSGMGLPKTSIPGNASGVLGLDFLRNFDVKLNPQTLELNLFPPSPVESQGISLRGKMGVMTAEVLINGEGPFHFLLDTGADAMVISQSLANRLSLKQNPPKLIDVQGFCGLEKGEEIQLKQVALGEHRQSNLTTIILQNQILDLLGVDGIVGQNFLKNYEQYWRFGPVNSLGFPDKGSLLLTPIKSPNDL